MESLTESNSNEVMNKSQTFYDSYQSIEESYEHKTRYLLILFQ